MEFANKLEHCSLQHAAITSHPVNVTCCGCHPPKTRLGVSHGNVGVQQGVLPHSWPLLVVGNLVWNRRELGSPTKRWGRWQLETGLFVWWHLTSGNALPLEASLMPIYFFLCARTKYIFLPVYELGILSYQLLKWSAPVLWIVFILFMIGGLFLMASFYIVSLF